MAELWPLAVGMESSFVYTSSWRGGLMHGQEGRIDFHLSVTRREMVRVAAGTFDTFVVTVEQNYQNSHMSSGTLTRETDFVSPSLGFIVKHRFENFAQSLMQTIPKDWELKFVKPPPSRN